jgi:hypothetical protein
VGLSRNATFLSASLYLFLAASLSFSLSNTRSSAERSGGKGRVQCLDVDDEAAPILASPAPAPAPVLLFARPPLGYGYLERGHLGFGAGCDARCSPLFPSSLSLPPLSHKRDETRRGVLCPGAEAAHHRRRMGSGLDFWTELGLVTLSTVPIECVFLDFSFSFRRGVGGGGS